MAIINTEDRYIHQLIKDKPEYKLMLDELIEGKKQWLSKYNLSDSIINYSMGVDEDHELIDKVKAVEIDLLKELKRVCDEYGLKLLLVYGTLLGAVRNGGIILGDDDVDVALPREDYDKLISLGDSFESPYFLQTPSNDNCFYGGYAKLRRSDTTSVIPQNWHVQCNEGISIDIFPLDYGYISKAKEKKKRKKITRLQRFLYAKAYGYFAAFMDMQLLVWKAYKYIGKFYTKDKLVAMLNEVLSSGDKSDEAPYGIYTHYQKGVKTGRVTSRRYFNSLITMDFEGIEMYAPKEWDKVLSDCYGEDYILPEDIGIDKMRHGFYNPEVPYNNYKKRFKGIFQGDEYTTRKIVLYGDKLMFEAYPIRYPDSQKQPWKTIDKNHMSELNNLDKDDTYLIICGFDIRTLEEQVRSVGFREYYIFCYNRDWIRYANYGILESRLEKELKDL